MAIEIAGLADIVRIHVARRSTARLPATEVESTPFGHQAVVVNKADADVTPGELIAWARERIAGYKLP